MTLYKPLWRPYAVTLTTHRKMDCDEYKVCLKRFFRVLRQYKIPAIYRHEMQSRGTPHTHMVMWMNTEEPDWSKVKTRERRYSYPDGIVNSKINFVGNCCLFGVRHIETEWLFATREYHDHYACRHSVMSRFLNDQDIWAVYLALHHGKENQLGFKGKAWGIINKDMLRERPHLDIKLTRKENMIIRRRLRKWVKATRQKQVKSWSPDQRLTWGLGRDVPLQLIRGLGNIDNAHVAIPSPAVS